MSTSEAADKEQIGLHKAVHYVLHSYGLAVNGLSSACDILSFQTALAMGCTITAAVSYASASQALHWPAWHRSGTLTYPPALVHLHSVADELLPSAASATLLSFQHLMQSFTFQLSPVYPRPDVKHCHHSDTSCPWPARCASCNLTPICTFHWHMLMNGAPSIENAS